MNRKLTFSGLKELRLPRRPAAGSADSLVDVARTLFRRPDIAVAEQRRSLVDFLAQVSLFEDVGRRDLARLARIVHEREYRDGEWVCEQGQPAAALFILRRGVVDVVRRGAGAGDVVLALLESPASFDESAAIGAGVTRWFSIRARGPVSLLALGRSDLDALIVNFPVLANKVLMRLAGIMAIRLEMLMDGTLAASEHRDATP
jgi:CRP/FNR family transcriptional regulator, cyclic AMP receptor protein